MPNRKTFDDQEKVDHSSHSTQTAEKGDLGATPDATPPPHAVVPPKVAGGAANSESAQPADHGASHTLHIRRRLRPDRSG
jgi:hypothetical protein